jgi:hypothetical protein
MLVERRYPELATRIKLKPLEKLGGFTVARVFSRDFFDEQRTVLSEVFPLVPRAG